MSILVRYEALPRLDLRAISLLSTFDRLRAAFAISRSEPSLAAMSPSLVRDLGLEQHRERAQAAERATNHVNFASQALGVRAGPLG